MKAGVAGVTTVGSKSILKSYEITSVLAPTRVEIVIGIWTTPGVAVTFGKDTAMVEKGVVAVPVFEVLLCNPKNSAAISIKAKRELSDANAVTFINRANAMAIRAMPLKLKNREDFWLPNMIM